MMKTPPLESPTESADFTTSILVRQLPEEVFSAVNNVRGWWSGAIEGHTDSVGAQFIYRYQDFHRSTQKITEWLPGKRIVWRVVDSRINFVRKKAEWTGTDIVFEITRNNGMTDLRFTHVGLVPTLECYDGCSGAWNSYITGSLRNLVTTGQAQPITNNEVA